MVAFYNTDKEPVEIAEETELFKFVWYDLSYNFTIACVNDLDKTERGRWYYRVYKQIIKTAWGNFIKKNICKDFSNNIFYHNVN